MSDAGHEGRASLCRRRLTCGGLLLLLLTRPLPGLAEDGPGDQAKRIVKEGIAVGLSIEPGDAETAALIEGRDAMLSFTLVDAATGRPLSGLYPAAWMDRRTGGDRTFSCKDKIRSFLQGTIAFRPDLDLNTWFLVTLDDRASLSVIDPLVGFGGQRLAALVPLDSPGADWAVTRDAGRLFVTLPDSGKVAVIDTAQWKVTAEIEPGPNPVRAALQPDERRLWVGIDARLDVEGKTGGVAVIDTETLALVGQIRTGAGHHEIAFSDDDRFAFVSNEQDGTVSVVDVRTLEKVTDIETGPRPVDLAYSGFGQALYAIDRDDGTISAIEGRSLAVTARIQAKPGLARIRFTDDGRWGLAVNPAADEVVVIDPALNRIVHRIEVPGRPDRVAFSESYAYVQPAESEQVSLIELAALGGAERVPVVQVPGGQRAPQTGRHGARADTVVVTPEEASVLIANPADGIVYYYAEGMGAPMGSYRNGPRRPRAVTVVDKSLAETAPGTYAADVKLPAAGTYDVAFLLDTPRVFHCFTAIVAPDPAAAGSAARGIEMDFLLEDRTVGVAEETRVRFRLTDPVTGQARDGVEDLRILATSPGIWQRRLRARPAGDGIYEVVLAPPRAGVYYLYFESASLGLRYDELPYLVLHAEDRAAKG